MYFVIALLVWKRQDFLLLLYWYIVKVHKYAMLIPDWALCFSMPTLGHILSMLLVNSDTYSWLVR